MWENCKRSMKGKRRVQSASAQAVLSRNEQNGTVRKLSASREASVAVVVITSQLQITHLCEIVTRLSNI